jgi:AcrR family transcriptional regulator
VQDSVSLRERKRLATSLDLHDAAADEALARGYQKVTVEEIAERAGVSQRTFFNYFASKEDAVLGIQAPVISARARETFLDVGTGDLLTRVVRLIVDVVRSTMTPGSSPDRRRQLMAAHPELRQRFLARVADAERLVNAAVAGESAGEQVPADIAALPDRETTIHALLYLAGATVRFIHFSDPGAVTADDEPAIARGITTFREAARRVV